MTDKKMMFCMCCGYSQLAAATDLLCCRCSGILVKAPQEHAKDFKYIGEYSGAEVQRRDDAVNEKRERQTI
jgi:geranylgeranyl pyrophosphate synthase